MHLNRRSFLTALSCLPFMGRFAPKPELIVVTTEVIEPAYPVQFLEITNADGHRTYYADHGQRSEHVNGAYEISSHTVIYSDIDQ